MGRGEDIRKCVMQGWWDGNSNNEKRESGEMERGWGARCRYHVNGSLQSLFLRLKLPLQLIPLIPKPSQVARANPVNS